MSTLARIGIWMTGICCVSLAGMTSCSIDKEPYAIEQTLDPFDTLTLNAVFDVVLQQGDHFGIEISGAKEIAAPVTYQIANRTLSIENNDGALWKHPELDPPLLIITFKTVSKINAYETCNITSADTIRMDSLGLTVGSKLNLVNLQIDCHLFYYWNSAPVGGQIIISGRTDIARFYNGSLMSIRAEKLIAHDALVANGSSSDIHVFADQHLYYSITGIGDIYLQGNPGNIDVGPITSTGKLIQ
jgi:hypothetical protein